MFSEKDIKQIESKGLSLQKVNEQIELFKKGLTFINLRDNATLGNGILKVTEEEKRHYVAYYNTKKNHVSILKFVPASGAATRMFKFLFQHWSKTNRKPATTEKRSLSSPICGIAGKPS